MKNRLKYKGITTVLLMTLCLSTPAFAWVYVGGFHGSEYQGVHYNYGYYNGVHRYYTPDVVVTTPAVVAVPERVWIPAHYRPNGVWVEGHYEVR